MPRKHRFAASVAVALFVVGAGRAPVTVALGDEVGDARKELAKAINARSPAAVRVAVENLVAIGGEKSISRLLKIIPLVPESEDQIYWTLVEGACSYGDREALEHLGASIVREGRGPLARDLVYGLSKNTSKEVIWALKPVIERCTHDLQSLAVQKLGKIPTREAVDVLISAMKYEERKVRDPSESELIWDIVDALTEITAQEFGPSTINWEGWWKNNRETAKLGAGARKEGHREGGGTVVEGLSRRRKKDFFGLEKAPKKGVVVLSATYRDVPPNKDLNNDHIEYVLDRMRVPHTIVFRKDFEAFDLKDTGALVINCSQFHRMCICPTCQPGPEFGNRLRRCTNCNKHVHFTAELSDAAIKKITDFVRRGGYLFGEDWVIKEVLARAYPKYVAEGEVLRKDAVSNVDVIPARGMATHPYLRGIFVAERIDEDDSGDDGDGTTVVGKRKKKGFELVSLKHRWAIDDESWAFKIVDSKKVLVLMSSGELQQKANGQGVVAFAFKPGGKVSDIGDSLRGGEGSDGTTTTRKRGRRARRSGPGVVLQVLSHFGKQGSWKDEYLLQNILLNFLIDANVERLQRNGPDSK